MGLRQRDPDPSHCNGRSRDAARSHKSIPVASMMSSLAMKTEQDVAEWIEQAESGLGGA